GPGQHLPRLHLDLVDVAGEERERTRRAPLEHLQACQLVRPAPLLPPHHVTPPRGPDGFGPAGDPAPERANGLGGRVEMSWRRVAGAAEGGARHTGSGGTGADHNSQASATPGSRWV